MSDITALSSTLVGSINSVQSQIKNVQTQLATGVKNLDPAQQGVVTRLSSQVTGYNAVAQNISQSQNVISVAQTGLASATNIVQQMQDLANKASTGTLSTTDLTNLQSTFASLATQVGNIATNATVNGANLLSSATGINVQTGITASDSTSVAGVDLAAIGTTLAGLDISTGAPAAITALGTALDSISAGQSQLSASAVGLTSQQSVAGSLSTNLQNTIDSIQKPDATQLQTQLQQLNNQQSIDYYLISQMNTESQAMLTIFR
jgi:flagellin-like hook-associated protein FlgL